MGQLLTILFFAVLAYYIINKIRYYLAKKKFEEYQAKKSKENEFPTDRNN